MNINLRPYQVKFINDIRSQFRAGKNRVVGVAPCGAGKTIMTGWIIRETVLRDKSAVFFVHRRELIDQTAATFKALGIPHGIIAGCAKTNYNYPVYIAAVQTLVNRLDIIPPPNLLVCDECHHILANSYLDIINCWNNSFLLGVTATPERIGGKRLGDVFNSMVQAPSVSDLIKLGNLTDFNYFDAAPPELSQSLRRVKVSKGDFVNGQLANVMDNVRLIGDTVKNYSDHAAGTQAVCYCVNVEHSKNVAAAFNSAGISAAHIDGKTDKNERNNIIDRFRRGKIKILCNVNLLGEGFDVPNCDTVILARPTMSLTLHIQQSMRSMRPNPVNPNKRAVIIDCVGNWKRHGVPDTSHEWSLDPNKPKAEGFGQAPFKKCPQCNSVVPAGVKICEFCGYEFPINPDIVEIETKSTLIHSSDANDRFEFFRWKKILENPVSDKQKKRAYFEATELATSYDEVLELTKLVGYKDGKAYYRWQELKKGLAKSPQL